MTREYPAIKACAEWFEANREDLLSKYSGRYLAIADGRVLGDYADQLEGIRAMLGSGRVAGTFIVHQCVPKEDELRIICHWQMRNPLPLSADWHGCHWAWRHSREQLGKDDVLDSHALAGRNRFHESQSKGRSEEVD